MAKRISVSHKSLEKWLTKASEQLQREDYHRVIMTCERILRAVSNTDPRRSEALGYMGTAYSMLNESSLAFEAFSQALLIDPDEFGLWYNRGVASLLTSRIGQAHKDFRQAALLCTEESYKARVLDRVMFTEKAVEEACALRGDDFTIEQLIEQEDLVQCGVNLMEHGKWLEATACFRDVIEQGDVLPQPWGNIGVCMLMEHQYDEAEHALKRALEIDPDYKLAQANLAKVEKARSGEITPRLAMSDPFADTKRSVDFLPE